VSTEVTGSAITTGATGATSGPGQMTGGLMSVEAARDAILAAAEPVATERISVADALGRVTAEAPTARVSLPPWPNSAMDGYAIVAADTAGATETDPIRLEVIGDVRAGLTPDVVVRRGTAARIATGARLADGADAVVPVEATTPLDATGAPGPRGRDATGPVPAACLVHEKVPAAGSVRSRATDLSAGAVLLQPGTGITPASLSLLAGAGVPDILVHRRPRVGVLATGDEIRSPGEDLGDAGIPDANGPGLRALVTVTGAEPIDLGIARDELDDVLGRLRGALDDGVDAIVVSGGVSVGPYDVVKTALDAVGRIDLWRVAVQPGKPFTFGTAPRPGGGAPVLLFGLPGNPVSSAVTFELFVRPAIRALSGRHDLLRPVDRAVLGEPVTKGHGRRAFLRVEAERDADGGPVRDAAGRVRIRLAGGQGSHVISALARADALAVISEADDALPSGAEVALWWLDRA
jgi:molybdopterin molybdotransferase